VIRNSTLPPLAADRDGDGVPDSCAGAAFIRGDPNADGRMNLSDAVFLVAHLFQGGPAPACGDAADSDGSGRLNITDPIYVLQRLFRQGPPLPAPDGACGRPAADPEAPARLGCAEFPACQN